MHRARRLGRLALAAAVATAALTIVLGVTAHPAGACSCATPSDREAAGRADAIVVGARVDRLGYNPYDPQTVIEVEEVLKGEAASRQGVLESDFGCGPRVEAGDRSLRFLDRDDAGRLHVMACSPSRPVDASAEVVVRDQGGDPPMPGSVVYAVGEPHGRWPLVAGLVVLLGLVGVIGLAGRALGRRAARAASSP